MNKQRVVSVLISLVMLFSFANVSPVTAATTTVTLQEGTATYGGINVYVKSVNESPTGPESCQDFLDANPSAADGDYVIYPNGKVFTVYCHDMAGTPSEYLTLANTGSSSNFSQLTVSDAFPGTNIVTRYTKVRLNPDTLLVNVDDKTFSSSTGNVIPWPTVVAMDYAVAADCLYLNTKTGLGNIDLRGTPFAVIDTFVPDGYYPAGEANFSFNNQVVDLKGGGYCGWMSPSNRAAGYDPYAEEAAFVLSLQYVPDVTSPTGAFVSQSPAANGLGWNNSDVTVTWNWADEAGGSGIDNANCTTSSVSTGEGAITLNATCNDLAGNTGNASYAVQVDKTAPTLNPVISPNPVPLNGAATVTPGAADALSGLASQSCGALDTSSAGAKIVTCTATDNAGNMHSVDASYTVLSPTEQITALVTTINSFNLNGGTANSLTSKLDNAAKSLGKNNTNAACGQVDAFINQVNALSGNKLTAAQAAELLASANQLKASIGCA